MARSLPSITSAAGPPALLGDFPITADEAVTMLPPAPSGKYKRTLARLYTLVGKTAGRASAALERGEELVSARGPPGGPGPQALAGASGALTRC